MSDATRRAERADAQRNRQRVLEVADRLFAERGAAVALGEIAVVAGVGAGTVYRHFPTKDALMATVLDRRLVQLGERARAVGRELPPGEAFFVYLRYLAEQALENRVLCESLAVRGDWTEPSKAAGRCVVEGPVAELLERAQRVGAVRGDIDVRDVMALPPAFVAMAMSIGSPERAQRMAAMLCEGLRPGSIRNADAGNETEPAGVNSNETGGVSSDETARRCPVCGGPIAPAGTGRPPKFCGAACRQKAFRDKRRAAALAAEP